MNKSDDITIGTLRDAKCSLETKLEETIRHELGSFKEITGVSIKAVQINFIDVTTWEERAEPSYIVQNIKLTTAIDL